MTLLEYFTRHNANPSDFCLITKVTRFDLSERCGKKENCTSTYCRDCVHRGDRPALPTTKNRHHVQPTDSARNFNNLTGTGKWQFASVHRYAPGPVHGSFRRFTPLPPCINAIRV